MMTCNQCGWVHFGVKRSEAQASVAQFSANPQIHEHYAGPFSIESYERCFLCGGSYKNMREAVAGDCPDGCTVQPIINSED